MRLWILLTLSTVSLLFNGCNTTLAKPELQKEIPTDKTLPIIELTKNGVVADMNAIAFEWKSLEDARVQGIYVYKQSLETTDKQKHKLYTTIKNRFVTHYVDNEVIPNTRYVYSFKTYSKNAQSLSSDAIDVKSLNVLDSVPWAYIVRGMPRSAKLIWRPHTNNRVSSYIIERRAVDEDVYKQVAEIKGKLSAEFIDTNLEDDKMYLYKIRVKTYDGILSSASKILSTKTKVLPNVVTNIKATTDLPKKIKLTWNKALEKDFYQYHVYRCELGTDEYILRATLYNNEFIDKIDEDGKAFKYRVSVVDEDGLESKYTQNTVTASTLVKPKAPILRSAMIEDENVVLRWKANDVRIVSYVVYKKQKVGWFKQVTQKIENLKITEYIDKNVVDGGVYTYKVFGVDKYGITSNYSNEIKVTVPKQENIVKLRKANEKALNMKIAEMSKKELEQTTQLLDTKKVDEK